MRTVIFIEGVTDELALRLAARRLGHDLEAEGVSVIPINGAHAMSRFLQRLAAEAPANFAFSMTRAKRKSSEQRWSARDTVQALIAAG